MLKRQKREIKIRSWISFGVIFIICIQAIVSVGAIILTGTPKHLDMSAVKSFSNMVMTREALFESQMNELGDIEEYDDRIKTTLRVFAGSKGLSVEDFLKVEENRKAFLDRMTVLVLDRLRNSEATSCFIILDREDSENIKDALILRDLNPNDASADNSDILVEAGSSSLMFEQGFTLDSFWNEHFTVTEDMDFFHEPYRAGNEYQDIDSLNLGYYSETTTFFEDDIKQICYSIPILDENHHSVGVIGYGVSLDYLKKSLPSKELGEDSSFTYCLGIYDAESNDLKVMMTENAAFQATLPIKGSFHLKKSEMDQLYTVENRWNDGSLYANLAFMKLYNTNTPFEKDRWVVVGVANGNSLFEASGRLLVWIGISVLISLVISLGIAMGAMYPLIFPIKALMRGIESSDNKMIESLPKTNIKEFDELADRIIMNNQMVYKMGGKVADIIDLADLALGVIEYDDSDLAFCNRQLLEMLDIKLESWKDNYVNKDELKSVLAETNSQYTRIEPYIFRRDCENGDVRYYRITHAETEDSHITIIMDATEAMEEQMQIRHDRDYDVLTNLYNRRAFEKKVKELVDGGKCACGVLAMWDLDRLKYVNDTYGHDVGDKYIKAMGNILRSVPLENHVSARLSGDEFVLFLYDRPEEELVQLAKELHKKIGEVYLTLPDGSKLQLGASGGLSRYSADGASYTELMRYADFAMYEMKKRTKGKQKLFEKDTYIRDYLLIYGFGELTNIIEKERVQYAFQPIVSLEDNHIFAYEALIRPVSDVLRTPDNLLRVAKEHAMNGQIERLTWYKALDEFFTQVGDRDCYIFINSIADQLLPEEDAIALHNLYGDKVSRIVMETTEQMKIYPEIERKKREWCNKWGMKMALDDFGTGYSNSDVLVFGSYNFIKIDQLLIRNIHLSRAARTLVESMVGYAHENGIKVIAEGVEVAEELEVLKQINVDYVQGFYIARPDFKMLEGDFWKKLI